MKKILSIFVALVAVLALAACGGSAKEGAGYGLVHKHYVGYVTVKVEADKVTEAAIDEYYLPYSLANVTAQVTGEVPADVVVSAKGEDGAASGYHAKYVSVDGVLFTAEGEEGKVPTYKAANVANIEEWVKTEANAKSYALACEAGKVFIANADGSKHATLKTQYEVTESKTGADAFKKSTTNYWREPLKVGIGWLANCEAMIEAIVGTTPKTTDETSRATEDPKVWSVNGEETGATWSDFNDYYAVFVRAFNNAA